MAPSRLDLLARSTRGDLYAWLRARRRAGLSYKEVSRLIASKYHVAVSSETARAWCKKAFDMELAQPVEVLAPIIEEATAPIEAEAAAE